MKKINFFTIKAHRVFSSLIILVMISALSCAAVFGIDTVSAAKIFNGVYYSGDETKNNISLMINVYWGTEYLEQMLKTLKENDVKTTFFVGGTWAVKESDMLKKIVEDGHEIGNHGYYHKDHNKLSAEKNYEEIVNTHKLVKELTGVEMNLFAPPSGAFNKKTVEIANQLGYKTIMWSQGKDTIDWRDKDSQLIYSRAVKNTKGGDFVLMHPTKATAEALPKIIKSLKEKNLNLCTVTQNLNLSI